MSENIPEIETIDEKIRDLRKLWERYFVPTLTQIDKDTIEEKLDLKITELLNLRDAESRDLHGAASAVRDANVGREIKVRGALELSNVCTANCLYCYLRRDNVEKENIRRLTKKEIMTSLRTMYDTGIREVFFQSGEDTRADKTLTSAIDEIKKDPKLSEMKLIVNIGDLDKEQYQKLASQGVSSYIMAVETTNVRIHETLRPHSSFQERLLNIQYIADSDLKLGTGFVLGFKDQSDRDIAKDIRFMKASGATESVSVSCFTPSQGTPLEQESPGNFQKTLNAIALLRILFPDLRIPAPSNSDSPLLIRSGKKSGLSEAIEAGANEITVNFTPSRLRNLYGTYNIPEEQPRVFLESALNAAEETGIPLNIHQS